MERKKQKLLSSIIGFAFGLIVGLAIITVIRIGITQFNIHNKNYGYVSAFHEEVAVANFPFNLFTGFGKYGYIDRNGNIVIDFQFATANSFSEGLAVASFDHKKYGYINHSGEWAIEPLFDYAGNFSDGKARVQIGYRWFYINTAGQILYEEGKENVPVLNLI